MKFILLRSTVFVKNAKKIIKKQPDLVKHIQET